MRCLGVKMKEIMKEYTKLAAKFQAIMQSEDNLEKAAKYSANLGS